jgi:hypothetical protein
MDDDELIEGLCAIEEGLTEWEVGFVESIAKQSYALTPKQRETAERIYDEKG